MNDRSIKQLLFLSILVVSVLPLIAALYLLDRSLRTSLNLGFNPQIAHILEDSSRNLLTLRTLDPERQQLYRKQFEAIEELRHVYEKPEVIRRSVLESLRIYFALGLASSIIIAVLVAALLGRRIARAYAQTLDELLAQREKVRYLQDISAWQELAKMLAHEIKNPLTPIEVLVSSLPKSHAQLSSDEFAAHLARTQTMIGEELQHLERTVDRFADFARLPVVQTVPTELATLLAAQLKAVAAMFPSARIELEDGGVADLRVALDTTLFRQVLTNIIRNGVEANPGAIVRFDVHLQASSDAVDVSIRNDGAPVPPELVPRLFDPYVSGKPGKENMGLGLAIVRKIVLDHGGDIRHECLQGHPAFIITLPRLRHG